MKKWSLLEIILTGIGAAASIATIIVQDKRDNDREARGLTTISEED